VPATLADPTVRRRERIARLLLPSLVAFGAFALAVSWLADRDGVNGLELGVSGVALLVILAGDAVARRGRPSAGIVVAVLGMEAMLWASFAMDGSDQTLAFLTVPILVAGLLLPLRAAAGTVAVSVGVAAGLDPALDAVRGSPPVVADDVSLATLLGSVALVALVVSWVLDGDLRLIERHTREVEAAQAALEAAAQDRRRMFNQVAHDLANPLSPMRIQLGVLRATAPEPAAQKAAAILDRSLGALVRQVEDLKDLSRIEAQSLRLTLAPMDLASAANEAAEAYRPGAEAAGLAMQADVPTSLPVVADRDRIQQVLANLVSNAIKFTASPGQVTLRARADGSLAIVEVQDTGRGLSASDMAQLFRPFAQVHTPGEARERGSGLGLFIARGIAEAHGGALDVASPGHGQGCTFTLRLPLAADGP